MYRLLKWDTSTGLLEYPETVNLESDKTLDVVTLKVLLPVRTEIAPFVAAYGGIFPFELVDAAKPVAEPVLALNLGGCRSIPPGTISHESLLRAKKDRILERPGFPYLREVITSMLAARIEVGGRLSRVFLEFPDGSPTGKTALKVRGFAGPLADVKSCPSSPLFSDD